MKRKGLETKDSGLQRKISLNLRTSLKNLNLRPFFYRISDERNKSETTVCLLIKGDTEEVVARGIAIKSPLDQPHGKAGNNMALGRAKRAYMAKRNSSPIVPNGIRNNRKCPAHLVPIANQFDFKCEVNPVLYNEEIDMVSR